MKEKEKISSIYIVRQIVLCSYVKWFRLMYLNYCDLFLSFIILNGVIGVHPRALEKQSSLKLANKRLALSMLGRAKSEKDNEEE